VYAGNPYTKQIQRPFLEAIRQLFIEDQINASNFKITFVGHNNNIDKKYIFRNKINQFFEYIDDVPHTESVKIQASADLLLLFSNFEPSICRWNTPGKFFEYLGLNKPILLVSKNKTAMAEYLAWTESGIRVDPDDIQSLKLKIINSYKHWKQFATGISLGSSGPARDHFKAENLTRKLDEILVKVR